ncbi:MAG: hypothetical protein ABIH11_02085 [Candidatus Altiarchaeota archaeon]
MDEGGANKLIKTGFNIGFLFLIVGVIVYFNEMMADVFGEMLDLLEIWTVIEMMPLYLKIIIAGFAVMILSISIGFMKDRVVEMMDYLFGCDEVF